MRENGKRTVHPRSNSGLSHCKEQGRCSPGESGDFKFKDAYFSVPLHPESQKFKVSIEESVIPVSMTMFVLDQAPRIFTTLLKTLLTVKNSSSFVDYFSTIF